MSASLVTASRLLLSTVPRPLHLCAFALVLGACGGEAPVVVIGPEQATTTDDLVATATTDSSKDLSYEWSRNGAIFDGYDGDTISHEATKRGEVWSVRVATNAKLNNAGEASITIENAPPTLLSLTIDPAEPRSDEVLTPVIDGEDPDGDEVVYSYLWHLNGQPTSILTETLGTDSTHVGDVWGVQVTPYDNDRYGEPLFAEVTILNGYPSVDTVTMTPTEACTEETVFEVTAAGSDPEGDEFTLIYRWYVDDALVLEGDTTTLDGQYFDKHQAVHVGVVGMDPYGTGEEAVSESATILNTPPGEPVVTVTPSSPGVEDDMVCVVETEAWDADDDVVSYEFSWTLDGAPFASTSTTTFPNDTVTSEHTDCEYAWACTVTTHDGEVAGPTVVAESSTICWEGIREFSTCGTPVGATGPDQVDCDTEYTGTSLDGEVTVTDGIQAWTVPADGTYVIDTYGAQGASGQYPTYDGGNGAWLQGTFDLVAGDVLYIIVGQRGRTDGSNGGGGGGSFVVDASDSPLIIAGGGGGTRTSVSQDGCDAITDTYAVGGSGSSMTSACPTKSSDEGEGGNVSSSSWGSAGGGFNSDGSSDSSGKGGSSWFNGGAGGAATAAGGFGGGGSGNGSSGGGGGGGYSGGDGGRVAGGGGSYNDGDTTDGADGDNAGPGSVTIDLVTD